MTGGIARRILRSILARRLRVGDRVRVGAGLTGLDLDSAPVGPLGRAQWARVRSDPATGGELVALDLGPGVRPRLWAIDRAAPDLGLGPSPIARWLARRPAPGPGPRPALGAPGAPGARAPRGRTERPRAQGRRLAPWWVVWLCYLALARLILALVTG